MDEVLHRQQQSRMESSLQELEQRTLVRHLTREQSEDYERKKVDGLRKPVYGEPARETRKGKTYVSKLKEEDRTRTKSDLQRLAVKQRLADIAAADRELAGDNEAFLAILDKIDAYVRIDYTAVQSGGIEIENEACEAILGQMRDFISGMIPKIEQGEATEQEKDLLNRTYELFGFFAESKNGYLPRLPSGARHLDATKMNIKSKMFSFETDASQMPLFPHEPCVNDISQRLLGDCYLLAGLASVVTTHPEKIKECMRDNQDGTVTVRFYEKQVGETTKFNPVYVTVTKKIPRVMGLADTFASNCLWVQMIERAYAASGLHVAGKGGFVDNPDTVYNELKRVRKKGKEALQRYAKESYPQYLDKNGELIRWEPSYEQIEGGFAGEFLEKLLGEEHQRELIEPSKTVAIAAKRVYSSIMADLIRLRWEETGGGAESSLNQMFFKLITNRDYDSSNSGERELLKQLSSMRVFVGNYLDAHAKESSFSEFGAEVQKHVDAFVEEWRKDESKSALFQSPYFPQVMDFFKREAAARNNRYTAYKPLSGQYNEADNALFQRIQDALAAGRYVGGGTVKFDSRKDGLNGETSENGIVGTHAYTVIDTELRSIQGRDYKFIKVRNPWGNSVRQYYTREGQEGLQAEKESSGNQGIFLIEFSDFIRKFKEVEIN